MYANMYTRKRLNCKMPLRYFSCQNLHAVFEIMNQLEKCMGKNSHKQLCLWRVQAMDESLSSLPSFTRFNHLHPTSVIYNFYKIFKQLSLLFSKAPIQSEKCKKKNKRLKNLKQESFNNCVVKNE